jgi:propanediol utilization protein
MVPQHRGGTLKTTKTAFKYISRVTLTGDKGNIRLLCPLRKAMQMNVRLCDILSVYVILC